MVFLQGGNMNAKKILLGFLIVFVSFVIYCKKENKTNKAWLLFLTTNQSYTLARVKLVGTIYNEGSPFANTPIKILSTSNSFRIMEDSNTTTNSKGEFTAYLRKGKYTFIVNENESFTIELNQSQGELVLTAKQNSKLSFPYPFTIMPIDSFFESGSIEPTIIVSTSTSTNTTTLTTNISSSTSTSTATASNTGTSTSTSAQTIYPTCSDGTGVPIATLSEGNLRISEIHYDVDTSKGFEGATTGTLCTELDDEFIEIYNSYNQAVDLNGASIQYGTSTGNFSKEFEFTGKCILQPSEYLVVVAKDSGCYTSASLIGKKVLFKGSSFSFSASGATFALVSNSTDLPDAQTGPSIQSLDGVVIDYVGTEASSLVYKTSKAMDCTDLSSILKDTSTNLGNNFTEYSCGVSNGTPGRAENTVNTNPTIITILNSNPSFEEYSPITGWVLSTSGVFESILASSINLTAIDADRIAHFTTLTSSISGREVHSNCFAIDATKNINLDGWFYTTETTANTKIGYKLYYFVDSNCTLAATTVFHTQTSFSLSQNNSWQQASYSKLSTDLPVDAKYAYISVRVQYISGLGTSNSQVYFDKIHAWQP